MGATPPTVIVSDIDYGPCSRILFDGADLGAVKGNVTIKITKDVVMRNAHQYGDSILSARSKGFQIEVDIEMEEFALAKLQTALDQNISTIAGNALTVGGLAGSEVYYGQLKLEPVNTNRPKLTVYKAAQVGNPEIVPGDAASSYKVTFKGFLDPSRAAGDQLYRFGDYDDTTAPTLAASWAGCAATDQGPLVITMTDTQSKPQTAALKYGTDPDANIAVLDVTTATAPTLIAGSIAIGTVNTTGTVTIAFTPATNWGTVSAAVVVMPSVRDKAGNRLATPYVSGYDIT